MRILLHTRFYPSVGGIETVAALLAREWIKAGESVTVVTDVPADPTREIAFSFPVRRRPSAREWIRLLRSHDVFIHFNISLRAIWPLLFVRRPFVAVHHGFYIVDRTGRRDWREKLKLWLAAKASKNIAVSEAVAEKIGIDCVLIHDPYDSNVFFGDGFKVPSAELIFVGRLVSDKGVDILLNALAILNGRGVWPRLTIVGEGPERETLEKLVTKLRLVGRVTFSGSMLQPGVADLLRAHSVLIVPSLVPEGFGLVAVEAVACGCLVIGSNSGGLPEAIGQCGITFPTGDAGALAAAIEQLLGDAARREVLRSHSTEHLDGLKPPPVARRYLEIMRQALCRN